MRLRGELIHKALESGLHTFLAFLLTSALFASPALSNHQDFAHFHPKGTTFHIHAITAFFSAEAAKTSLNINPSYEFEFTRRFFSEAPFLTTVETQAHSTRAPPFLG